MKQIKITITNIASSGHGTAEHSAYGLVHVLGAFPGDQVMARVYKTIGSVSYAEIISFLEYSLWRTSKPEVAPFFAANMPWEHLSDEAEEKYKQDFVYGLYEQDLSIELQKSFTSKKIISNPALAKTHYRNKVAYSFMKNKKGTLTFALYTRGAGDTVKVEQTENPLAHPLLEKTGKQFLQFFNQKQLDLRDLKYLILRYSYSENTVVAHILAPETNRKKIAFKKSDLENFLKNIPHISGVLVSHSERGIRSAMTTKDFYKIGNITLTEKVLEKTYTYHPSLFFQIYPAAFESILSDLRMVIENIPNRENLSILDLFAGVGIIGLEVADLVPAVTGVEISTLSGKYARKNAALNTIDNFTFTESSVDDILNYIETNQILIVDPTRAGLSDMTIETILEKQPKYIAYISCNPETQHDNFEKLKELYTITFAKAYNIFPKTHHVESMIVLEKK
ncbi:MAG: class I SAM-dependent RNA methyltransferase [Minisyncoccia bacterium]